MVRIEPLILAGPLTPYETASPELAVPFSVYGPAAPYVAVAGYPVKVMVWLAALTWIV